MVHYISPKVETIINKQNIPIELNQPATKEALQKVVDILVNTLENSVGLGNKNPFYDLLVTNHGLKLNYDISSLTFSGGVADCLEEVLSEDWFRYGDIGLLLGYGVRKSKLFSEKQVLPSEETIRATVVGAGSHTAEVSGSTISYTGEILPIKNLPILKISKADEQQESDEMALQITEKLNWHRLEEDTPQIVLAVEGKRNPSFADIQRYAAGIITGLNSLIKDKIPLIVIVKEDMAKALGHSMFAALPKGYPFICLDSVVVENGDYIDIGKPVAGGAVLPVIVKTLVFN